MVSSFELYCDGRMQPHHASSLHTGHPTVNRAFDLTCSFSTIGHNFMSKTTDDQWHLDIVIHPHAWTPHNKRRRGKDLLNHKNIKVYKRFAVLFSYHRSRTATVKSVVTHARRWREQFVRVCVRAYVRACECVLAHSGEELFKNDF